MRVDVKLEPDLNSDRIVAKLIFETCTYRTKQIIQRGEAEGVHDLNLVTEGYARAVRDELIKLIRAWKP